MGRRMQVRSAIHCRSSAQPGSPPDAQTRLAGATGNHGKRHETPPLGITSPWPRPTSPSPCVPPPPTAGAAPWPGTQRPCPAAGAGATEPSRGRVSSDRAVDSPNTSSSTWGHLDVSKPGAGSPPGRQEAGLSRGREASSGFHTSRRLHLSKAGGGGGGLEVPGGPRMVPDVQKMRLCARKGRARWAQCHVLTHAPARAHTAHTPGGDP